MRQLLKDMSIYGLGGVLSRTVQLLLLPVYTRVLAPADYGCLELVYLVANILAILYGLMISTGYIRVYYDSKEPAYRDRVLGSAFWFTTASTAIFFTLSFASASSISEFVFGFDDGVTLVMLVTLSTGITAHSRVLYNVLMVREQARSYVGVNLITLLLTMGITIYFVVGLKWGVKGVLLAQISGYSIELIVLAALVVRRSILSFSFGHVREMLAFSMPLIPLQIASFVIALSDRFFLKEYSGLSDVGLYSLGYKFASVLPILTIEPFKAFSPRIFSLIDRPDECKKMIADFTRYYLAVSLTLALAISMFSREVIAVMSDESFHDSYRVIYILCASQVLLGVYNLSRYANNIVKKNWIIMLSWILASILNVGLNLLLVPRYGMYGAAVSSVTAYAALVVANLYATRRIYPIHFSYSRLVQISLLAVGVFALSTLADREATLSIPIKATLLAVFVVVVLKTRYFDEDEIRKAKRLILRHESSGSQMGR